MDAVRRYVSQATGDLVSRLLVLLDKVEDCRLPELSLVIHGEQWADFRSYVAHLWREKQNLDAVLAETEQLLRQTFGYSVLQAKNRDRERRQAEALRTATRNYVRKIAENPGGAMLADSTGFAPEGVMRALAELGKLPRKLTPTDWEPQSLFGPQGGSVLSRLVGVMMHVPELKGKLQQLSPKGLDQRQIAQVAQAWVTGASLAAIARRFFSGPKDDPRTETEAITTACRAIYKQLANAATWGLSALSKLGPSGLDYEKLPPDTRRQINSLPAMLYHGVATEAAVLMRMNAVPRTVAENLGKRFGAEVKVASPTSRLAREFLRTLDDRDWQRAAPSKSALTGTDYKAIWQRLAGETG